MPKALIIYAFGILYMYNIRFYQNSLQKQEFRISLFDLQSSLIHFSDDTTYDSKI